MCLPRFASVLMESNDKEAHKVLKQLRRPKAGLATIHEVKQLNKLCDIAVEGVYPDSDHRISRNVSFDCGPTATVGLPS